MPSIVPSEHTFAFKTPERFEAAEVKKLRPEFERFAARNCDLVIDMARTEAIDGSGIGAIVFVFKRLMANGHRLTVRNITGQPRALLTQSGLLRVLNHDQPEGFWRVAARRLGVAAASVAANPDTTTERAPPQRAQGAA